MITFAFTVLAFVLFAGIGVFAYYLAKRQFEAAIKGVQSGARASERKRRKDAKQFKAQLSVMAENIRLLAGEKKKEPLINTEGMAPWQIKMEERAIKEQRHQVVAVDDKLLKKSA